MLPTRITEKTATLIENIFVNGQTQKYNSGNITMSITDHFHQLIILENGKEDKPFNKTAKTTYKGYKNFDMESFKIDLFNTILDKHAPIKEFTKKKEKDKLKPRVTKGIKKYISVRDKIYKQITKEKDQLVKTEKHKKFKACGLLPFAQDLSLEISAIFHYF